VDRTNTIRVVAEAQLAAIQQAVTALQQLQRTTSELVTSTANVAPAAQAATQAVNRSTTANQTAARTALTAASAYDRLRQSLIAAASVPAARLPAPAFSAGTQPRGAGGQFAAATALDRMQLQFNALPTVIQGAIRGVDAFGRASFAASELAQRGLTGVLRGADAVAGALTGAASRARSAWEAVRHPLARVTDEATGASVAVGVLARAADSLRGLPGGTALMLTLQGIAAAAGIAGTALSGMVRAAAAAGGAVGAGMSAGASVAARAVGALASAAAAAAGALANLLRSSLTLASAGFGALAAGARTAAGAIGTLATTAAATAAGVANALGMISLALSAIGAGAVVAGTGFEQNMNRVFALADTTREEFDVLREQVLQLGREIPLSLNQLAEGFYFVVSAGVAVADSFDVLRVSAQAALAGQADLGVVADGVTSVILAYGQSNITAAHAADILTRAVVLGKTEYDTFAHSLGRVLPLAAQLEIGFDEVAASLAVMTRLGLNSDEAATALRAALSSLAAPARETIEQLAAFGEAGFRDIETAEKLRDVISNRGLVFAFQRLYEAAGGNIDVLDRIIPNIRGLTGFLTLANSQADEYAEVVRSVNEAQEGTGATATAFSRAMETTRNQLGLTINLLTEIGVRFYDSVRDPIQAAAKAVNAFLISIVEWQDANPELFASVSRTAALIVGLSTALFGLSIAGRFLAPLIGFFAMFGLMSSRGSASILNFGLIMRAITIPIGLLTAAWIALNMQVDRNVEGLQGLRPWLVSLSGIFLSLVDIVKAASHNIGLAFAEMFGGGNTNAQRRNVGALFDLLVIRVQLLIRDIVRLFRDMAPRVISGLRGFVAGIGGWIRETAPRIGILMAALALEFWDWVRDVTPRVITGLREWLGNIVDWIRTTGAPAAGAALRTMAERFVNWIRDVDWEQIRTNLWAWATGIGSWLVNDFGPWIAEQAGNVWDTLFSGPDDRVRRRRAPNLLESFGTGIGTAVSRLGSAIADALPIIFGALAELTPKFLTFIGGLIGEIVPAAARIGAAFVDWVAGLWPNLVGGLNKFRMALIDWAINAIPIIADTVRRWADSFGQWVLYIWPGLRDGLGDLITSLVGFVGDAVPRIATAVATWTGAFLDWALQVGATVVIGLVLAFNELIQWISEPSRVRAIAEALLTWTTAFAAWVTTDLIPNLVLHLAAAGVAVATGIAMIATSIGTALARALPAALSGFDDAIRKMEGPVRTLARVIELVLIVSLVRLSVVLSAALIGRIVAFASAIRDAVAAAELARTAKVFESLVPGGFTGAIAKAVAALKDWWTKAVLIFTGAGGGLAGGFAVLRTAITAGLAALGVGAVFAPLALAVAIVWIFQDQIHDIGELIDKTLIRPIQKGLRDADWLPIEIRIPLQIAFDILGGDSPQNAVEDLMREQQRLVEQVFATGSVFDQQAWLTMIFDADALNSAMDVVRNEFVSVAGGSLERGMREVNDYILRHPQIIVPGDLVATIRNAISGMLSGHDNFVEGPSIHFSPEFQVTDGWQTSLDQTLAQVQIDMTDRARERAIETNNVEFFTDVNIRIRNQREAITAAIDQLVIDMNNPQNLAQEQLHLEALIDASSAPTIEAAQRLGGDAGAALWRAYNDPELANDPLVQSGADAIVAMIQERLGILPQEAHETGVATAQELLAGAHAGIPGGGILPDTAMLLPDTAVAPLVAAAGDVGTRLGTRLAENRNQALLDFEKTHSFKPPEPTSVVWPAPDISLWGPAGRLAAANFVTALRQAIPQAIAATNSLATAGLPMLMLVGVRFLIAGGNVARMFATGITTNLGGVVAAANLLGNAAIVQFSIFSGYAYQWGYRTGISYANGITAAGNAVANAAWSTAIRAASVLKATSPPGPESPLHNIVDWGFRTMMAWADGITAARDRVAEAARGVVAVAADELGTALAISPTVEVSAIGGTGTIAPIRRRPDDYGQDIPQGIAMNKRAVEILNSIERENKVQNEALARLVTQTPEAAGPLPARGTLERMRMNNPIRTH
jgi:TP901 family phage tail tape measure protein